MKRNNYFLSNSTILSMYNMKSDCLNVQPVNKYQHRYLQKEVHFKFLYILLNMRRYNSPKRRDATTLIFGRSYKDTKWGAHTYL